jgi:hypothetical protein
MILPTTGTTTSLKFKKKQTTWTTMERTRLAHYCFERYSCWLPKSTTVPRMKAKAYELKLGCLDSLRAMVWKLHYPIHQQKLIILCRIVDWFSRTAVWLNLQQGRAERTSNVLSTLVSLAGRTSASRHMYTVST